MCHFVELRSYVIAKWILHFERLITRMREQIRDRFAEIMIKKVNILSKRKYKKGNFLLFVTFRPNERAE